MDKDGTRGNVGIGYCRIGPMLKKIGEPDNVKALGQSFLRSIFELLLSFISLMNRYEM